MAVEGENLGTATIYLTVDKSSMDATIGKAKLELAGMGAEASKQYEAASAGQRKLAESLVRQAESIGKTRAREPRQQGEIYELYLRPEYQGIGLGSRLFKAAKARLADHGLRGLVVWALEDNHNALAFYAGNGGRDIAEGVEVFEQKALKKVAFVWND